MIRVYNTLSKTKEPFEPVQPGKVGIYLCGPTVYKPSHIGHMVGPVIFDTIKRYLVYNGYEVDAGGQHHRRRRQADRRVECAKNVDGRPGRGDDRRLHAEHRGPGRGRDRPLPAVYGEHRRDHRLHPDVGRQGHRLLLRRRRVLRREQGPGVRQAEPSPRRRRCRGKAAGWPTGSGTRPTSPSGKGPSRASLPGRALGEKAGPAGTSNARR